MTNPNAAPPSISTLPTPLGDMILACTPKGVSGLWFMGQAHFPPEVLHWPQVEVHHPQQKMHSLAQEQVLDYFIGQRRSFELPIDLTARGTEFEKDVWGALQNIPWGQKISYGELAKQLNRPLAARAVGAAVGKNPISLIVPCHRVCGANGALTGYAGGLDKKAFLWTLESANASPSLGAS